MEKFPLNPTDSVDNNIIDENKELKKLINNYKFKWRFMIKDEFKIFNIAFFSFPILPNYYKLNDKNLQKDYYEIIHKIYESFYKIENMLDNKIRIAKKANLKKKLFEDIYMNNNYTEYDNIEEELFDYEKTFTNRKSSFMPPSPPEINNELEQLEPEIKKITEFLYNNLLILNTNLDKFKEAFKKNEESLSEKNDDEFVDEFSPTFLIGLVQKRRELSEHNEFIEKLNEINKETANLLQRIKDKEHESDDYENNTEESKYSDSLYKLGELFNCNYKIFSPLKFSKLPEFIELCESLTEKERKNCAFIKIMKKNCFSPNESTFNKLCDDSEKHIINLFFKNLLFSNFVSQAQKKILKHVTESILEINGIAEYFDKIPELFTIFLSPDEEFTKVLIENSKTIYEKILESNFDKLKTINTVYSFVESLYSNNKKIIEENNTEDEILEI